MNKFNLLMILILSDIVFTIFGVKYLGATELNPLCSNFNVFIIFKTGVSIICLGVIGWIENQKYTKPFLTFLIILYGVVGISNVYQTVNYLYY